MFETNKIEEYRYIAKFTEEGSDKPRIKVFEGINKIDAKSKLYSKHKVVKMSYMNPIYNPNKPVHPIDLDND